MPVPRRRQPTESPSSWKLPTFLSLAHTSMIRAGSVIVYLSMAGCTCTYFAHGHWRGRFQDDNAYGATANALEDLQWHQGTEDGQALAIFGVLLVICGLLARRVQQQDDAIVAALVNATADKVADDPPTGQTEKGAPAAHWALPPKRH